MREAMTKDQQSSDSAGDPRTNVMIPAAGLMVIRTWHEAVHPQGFRARISYGQSPDTDPSTLATADPAEILRVVREWLATSLGGSNAS
jgi:hypothetical protein